MTRTRRLVSVFTFIVVILCGAWLIISTFNDNIMFFYSPTDILDGKKANLILGHEFRLGGVVKVGSVRRDGLEYRFIVTDYANEIEVCYHGMVPNLFKEGQGVVAMGRIREGSVFIASELLAKHDENYMPPEISLQPAKDVAVD